MKLNKIMADIKKLSVSMLSASGTICICIATSASYATDIEIYKVPEESVGKTTILLMLDTSGSMDWAMGNGNNQKRLDVLKQGLRDVLSGTATIPRIDDKIVMGLADFGGANGRILLPARPLGEVVRTDQLDIVKPKWIRYSNTTGIIFQRTTTYYLTCLAYDQNNQNCLTWSSSSETIPSGFTTGSPYKSNVNVGCTYGNNRDCTFIYESIPQQKVVTHRDSLLSEIERLTPNGGTPTPYAYAEAAAYLMGQGTDTITSRQAYFVSSSSNYRGWYKECTTWDQSGTCTAWVPAGNSWYTGFDIDNTKYTKGASGNLGLSGNYYLGRFSATGFDISVASSKSGNNYIAPTSITEQLTNNDKKTCSGQGIYFLTDGEPEPNGIPPGDDGKSGTAYTIMSNVLGSKASSFSCKDSPLGTRSTLWNSIYNKNGYKNDNNAWNCVGNFAQALLSPEKNPIGLQIKTAVVGFSSGFTADDNFDVQEAKLWGTVGGGGSYLGTNSESIVISINKFIQEINKDIPSMSTGSSVIPTDALNPSEIQRYAYFPQFEPKVNPADKQQVWFGNLKKYYAVNNGVYASPNGDSSTVVVDNGKLQDLADIWGSGLSYSETTPVFAKYGALSRILWGKNSDSKTQRILLTDYKYENNVRNKDLDLVQIKHTYTLDNATKADTTYSRAFMALLGYDLSTSVVTDAQLNGFDVSDIEPSVKQMGSPLHSEPLLITQEGRLQAERNKDNNAVEIISKGREDYVLFGTTQGLVHVVDAATGAEKFAFVPKEIIENQAETFKNLGGNLTGGKNALYYGMDGEWVAHTNYVTKSDGTLTVKKIEQSIVASDQSQELIGKQWVYGGMRMGGRSYYALDLTDIDAPKVKFHIDPTTGKVYSQETSTGKEFKDISKMGQSWSKPVLGYVNWKGSRKLVMFVGGGYDAGGTNGDGLYVDGIRTGYEGYEMYNYKQTNKIGSGVYMFDADNGDLLWRTSATHENDTNVTYLTNSDLQYSVASPVNTVDRNNDGLIDHIYFGDLAGQGFRVDFANDAKDSNSPFTSQIFKVLDVHESDGTSPRFYNSPLFTAHRSAGQPRGANIVMAIFASGNKSSPLLGTVDSPIKTDSIGLKHDGVFAIYDYDAYNGNGGKYPYGLSASSNIVRKLGAESGGNPATNKLMYLNSAATGAAVNSGTGWGGWYYLFKNKMSGMQNPKDDIGAGLIKSLRPLIAMENNLYVTQFDPLDNGTTTSCGAGVKGNTFTTRLCLPTGLCGDNATYVYNLGAGDVGLNVGPGDNGTKMIYVTDPANAGGINGKTCVGDGCKGDFIPAGGTIKFIPHKWYEKYSRQGAGG